MFRRSGSLRGRSSNDGAAAAAATPVLDGKTGGRIKQLLSALVKSAGHTRFKLSTRAPCLKSIAARLQTEIESVFKNQPLENIQANAYFPTFIAHLEYICNGVLGVLSSNPASEIADPSSDVRSEIVRQTLLLNHVCFELQSQYRDGIHIASVDIQLPEPRRFWRAHFRDNHVVTWDVFVDALGEVFGRDEVMEVSADLKCHVDLCEDGRISWWEFDVFSQLFQPWDRILNTWAVLTKKHPGYKAWLTYEEVQKLLQPLSHKPGSYCFRMSVTRPGLWSIGFVSPYGLILQALPTNKSLYQALIDGAADGSYLYPLGQDENIDPREHMPVTADRRIQVSQEQHEIYMRMDSHFELCKICHNSRKNLRMDPCGHLICRRCFDGWSSEQRRGGGCTICPFCRGTVSDTVTIEVENKHSTADIDVDSADASSGLAASAFISVAPRLRYQGGAVGAAVRRRSQGSADRVQSAADRRRSEFATLEELEAERRAAERQGVDYRAAAAPLHRAYTWNGRARPHSIASFPSSHDAESMATGVNGGEDDDDELAEAIRRSLEDQDGQAEAPTESENILSTVGSDAAVLSASAEVASSARHGGENGEERMIADAELWESLSKEDLLKHIQSLQKTCQTAMEENCVLKARIGDSEVATADVTVDRRVYRHVVTISRNTESQIWGVSFKILPNGFPVIAGVASDGAAAPWAHELPEGVVVLEINGIGTSGVPMDVLARAGTSGFDLSLTLFRPPESRQPPGVNSVAHGSSERVVSLEEEIAALRGELAALKEKNRADNEDTDILRRKFTELTSRVIDHAPHLLERDEYTLVSPAPGRSASVPIDFDGQSSMV